MATSRNLPNNKSLIRLRARGNKLLSISRPGRKNINTSTGLNLGGGGGDDIVRASVLERNFVLPAGERG